jgi:hypothetical protein
MKIASVVLSMILCSNSLGQSKGAESSVNFRAGFGEQLVTSCRAADEVTRMVGTPVPIMDLAEDFKKSGTCVGFIEGMIDYDTISHTDDSGHPTGRNLCVPPEASATQLAKVVAKYGDDHPEQLHFPARSSSYLQ